MKFRVLGVSSAMSDRQFDSLLGTPLRIGTPWTAPQNMHGRLQPSNFSWKIIDTSRDQVTLQILEALHIDRRKPALNTREEYRQRELTIRI